MGTTLSFAISGWRAPLSNISPSSLMTGRTPRILPDSAALANTTSMRTSMSMLPDRSSAIGATSPVSSSRMRSISASSSAWSCRMLLLISTTAIGSMKRVCPLAEWSWISPGTCDLYSCFTGTT